MNVHGHVISGLKLRHSIIRRSAGVTTAFLIGHVFSYAIVFGANQILDSGGFGLFYAALLAVTVVHSPMTALTLVLARRIAGESAAAGPEEAARITWLLVALCMKWGVPAAVLLGIGLAVAGPLLGVEAWQILLLIPGAALAIILVEILRVSLQSMLLFSRASLLWLTSQGAQMLLSLAFLWFFGRVWTGILGVLAGAALVFAAYAVSFARTVPATAAPMMVSVIWPLVHEAPLVLAYSLFILISNIDILIGYALLSRAELDIYAASALLPKAIITATFAVAQVLLPVMVKQRMDGIPVHLSVLKAIAMVGGMSVAAGFVLWFAVPFVQTTPFAIRGLDFSITMILATGAVALSAIRILVVVESAIQRYAIGLAQSVAIVLFIVLSTDAEARAYRMAELHTMVVWGFLIAAGGFFALLRTRRYRSDPFGEVMTTTRHSTPEAD